MLWLHKYQFGELKSCFIIKVYTSQEEAMQKQKVYGGLLKTIRSADEIIM